MRRVRKFFALPAADRLLLVESLLVTAAVKVGLSLLSFKTLLRLVSRLSKRPAEQEETAGDVAEKVAWALEVARVYVPGETTCLTQALSAAVLLSRRGWPAEIRIGVDKTKEEPFRAHAWVECRGRAVVGGEELARYVPFPALEWKSY